MSSQLRMGLIQRTPTLESASHKIATILKRALKRVLDLQGEGEEDSIRVCFRPYTGRRTLTSTRSLRSNGSGVGIR